MPTLQETYDKIVNGLRVQNCKSLNGQGLCFYRGLNGTKCAAGHVIPDSKYNSIMEGGSVCDITNIIGPVLDRTRLLYQVIVVEEGHNANLVQELQQIHDHIKIENWEKYFKDAAYKFNLIYTPKQ